MNASLGAGFSPRFLAAARIVLGDEGPMGNDPGDHGGLTRFGWAQTYWPSNRAMMPADVRNLMPLNVAELDEAEATLAYHAVMWLPFACDDLPSAHALVLFDACVNQGPSWAPRAYQNAIGAWPDGHVGTMSIACAFRGGPKGVLASLGEFCWLRETRYRASPDFPKFGHGWIERLARVTAQAYHYADAVTV